MKESGKIFTGTAIRDIPQWKIREKKMCIRDRASPSLAQAKRLRKLDKEGKLNGDVIDGILSEPVSYTHLDVYKRQRRELSKVVTKKPKSSRF